MPALNEKPIDFRTLVVEDQPQVLESLCNILSTKHPQMKVDRALTVREAMCNIDQHVHMKIPYELALLDFLLPQDRGDQPETDVTICERLKTLRVPIIHYTASPEDEKIRRHMLEVHPDDELSGAPVRLVKKTMTTEWVDQLLRYVTRHYHRRVNEMMVDRLRDCRNVAIPQQSMCGAPFVIRLHQDIMNHWDMLLENTKAAIRNVFEVVDLDGPDKRLRLIAERESETDVDASA